MKRHKSVQATVKRGSSKSPKPSKVGKKKKNDKLIDLVESEEDGPSHRGKSNRTKVKPLKKGKKIKKMNVVKRGKGRPPKVNKKKPEKKQRKRGRPPQKKVKKIE